MRSAALLERHSPPRTRRLWAGEDGVVFLRTVTYLLTNISRQGALHLYHLYKTAKLSSRNKCLTFTVSRGDGGVDREPMAKGSDFNHKVTVWLLCGFNAFIVEIYVYTAHESVQLNI